MTEKKKDKNKAAEGQLGEVLKAALAEEMGEIPEASITVTELQRLGKAKDKSRRKRIARYVSVAAVAVIVCAAVLYLAWPEAVVPVDADKNTEQNVETGDGEIIINDGDVQGESGITEITETDWENVKKHRQLVEKLAIPQYISKGYTFKSLSIEKYGEDGFFAEYIYEKQKDILCIEQRYYTGKDIRTTKLQGKAEEIQTKVGKVYVVEEKNEPIIISRYLATGYLNIVGKVSTAELVKILVEIEMP